MSVARQSPVRGVGSICPAPDLGGQSLPAPTLGRRRVSTPNCGRHGRQALGVATSVSPPNNSVVASTRCGRLRKWRGTLWLGVGVATVAAVAAASAFARSGGVVTPTFDGDAIGSAASGHCSRAAARQVVRQLRLGDPSVPDPVGKVLCGSFTGPGSQTMVVSLVGPGNTGLIEWAVFRWAGGWRFLMKQSAAASITGTGSDIRQTLPVYRPDDARCCPSGGTKTRIWHWNGSRLVAGPWKQSTLGTAPTPAAGALTRGHFKTPSGNIFCGYFSGKPGAGVECVIKSAYRPPLPRRGPGCSRSYWISLGATGRVRTGGSVCPGEDDPEGPFIGVEQAWVLSYGKTWSGGGLRCTSAITGLTCRNKSGHGFFLSRAHWRAF